MSARFQASRCASSTERIAALVLALFLFVWGGSDPLGPKGKRKARHRSAFNERLMMSPRKSIVSHKIRKNRIVTEPRAVATGFYIQPGRMRRPNSMNADVEWRHPVATARGSVTAF